MEYIMINEGKLKVMLEQGDLEEWDISVDALDYCNPEAKTVFEDILQYAKETLGFDTAGHKVLLQLYPSRDGGCELFITKLPKLSDSGELYQVQKNEKINRAYSFERLSYLLSVCKKLFVRGFYGESSVWTDEDGKWYLIISQSDTLDANELPLPDGFSFISEYGDIESPRALSLYLGEYAQSICAEGAVQTLGKI